METYLNTSLMHSASAQGLFPALTEQILLHMLDTEQGLELGVSSSAHSKFGFSPREQREGTSGRWNQSMSQVTSVTQGSAGDIVMPLLCDSPVQLRGITAPLSHFFGKEKMGESSQFLN